MKSTISISTGLIYKFYSDRNEMIEILSKFNPDGIELSFFDSTIILNFEINEKSIAYLKTLQHVSIHAPWKNITYEDSEHCHKVLQAIEKLARKIDAKVVVIEREQIKDFNVFNGYNLPFAIENDDWRKETDAKTIEDVGKILEINPALGFCLDVAHAMTIRENFEYANAFIEKNGQRISQVHTSMIDRTMSDHTFLCEYDNEKLREMIRKIKSLQVPIVLEAVALSEGEINNIKKEIEYIRNI
ncbi:MAG TPA: hypothetical protein VF817_05255 [Patescibacteria group bacterium]